jgi:hypothetical protein
MSVSLSSDPHRATTKEMPLRLGTRIAGQQRSEAGGTYRGAVMFK